MCVVCVHVSTCTELPQGIHPCRDLAKKLPERKTQVCLKNAEMARLRCLTSDAGENGMPSSMAPQEIRDKNTWY